MNRQRTVDGLLALMALLTVAVLIAAGLDFATPARPASANVNDIIINAPALGSNAPEWPSTHGAQTDRVFRDGFPSTCAVPKAYPGTTVAGPKAFDRYEFVNGGGDGNPATCITITMNTGCTNDSFLFVVAYLNSFNPADVSQNYLGDIGSSPNPTGQFSVMVPAGQKLILVVSQVFGTPCATPYTLNVSGFSKIVRGQKFEDLNGNGIKEMGESGLGGWTIYVDLDNSGTFDPGEPCGVTDGNGFYQNHAPPGMWPVREVQQAGWLQTTPDPRIINVVNTTLFDVDFGNQRLGSISGTKYDDLNGDGFRQMGEPGLDGWTIQLDKDADGTVDDTEVTAGGGNYTFANLPAGTYRLREVLQPDYQQTSANPADVPLAAGQNVTGIDFGNFELFDLCVHKFHDLDKDGVREPGETGIEGFVIYLDENGNDTFDPGEPNGQTDINGDVCFTNLGPGTYRVREVIPEPKLLWKQTTLNPPPFDGASGADVNVEFGNKRLPRMVVSPGALTFGSIARNTSTERSWVVYNTGIGDLMINVPHQPQTPGGVPCPDFQLLTQQGGAPVGPPGVQNLVIPPGQARVFWVRFRPTRLGPQSCYFRVQGVFPFEDPARPFQNVNVSGTGR
jgi:hypothetical protein